jgi:acyl dehydratase
MKWDEIAVPCDLPETVDEISYERVIMNAGTTWDYIPWHFDPGYARSHGHPTIFVNTMHLAGFIDRIATAWAGPPAGGARRSRCWVHLRRRLDGGPRSRDRQAARIPVPRPDI